MYIPKYFQIDDQDIIEDFIEKYNPSQFVILGLDKEFTYDGGACSVRGRKIYTRIFIRKTLATIAE